MHIGNIDVRLGLRALAYEVAVALLVEHRKLVAAVVVNICGPGKDDGVYSPQHRDGLICKVLDIGTDLVDADLPVVLVGIAEAGNGVALIPQSLNHFLGLADLPIVVLLPSGGYIGGIRPVAEDTLRAGDG